MDPVFTSLHTQPTSSPDKYTLAPPAAISVSSATDGTDTASSSHTMALPLTPLGHLYRRKGGEGGLLGFASLFSLFNPKHRKALLRPSVGPWRSASLTSPAAAEADGCC